MILNVYAVRDRATVQFGSPMFMVSDGQAIRSFGDEVNRKTPDGTNQLYNHSSDFDLYKLGTFDSDTGLFSTTQPEQIATGKQLRMGDEK